MFACACDIGTALCWLSFSVGKGLCLWSRFECMQGITASRRVPTLVEVHGKDLNWSLYEDQTGRFKAWLSKPFNPERSSNAVQSAEAIRKVEFAVQNALVHASTRCDWGPNLSYEWFLSKPHFDEIFTAYGQYAREERGNACTNVAKQLGELKHAVQWASCQKWSWGSCKKKVSHAILNKLSILQSQYTNAGTVEVNRKREANRLLLSNDDNGVTLQAYTEHVDQMESKLFAKFGELEHPEEASEASDDDKLAVAECLLLKLLSRGGRGIDLHKVLLMSRGDYDTVDSWIRDVNESQTILVGGDEWPNYLWQWQLFVLSSKGHFVEHPLDGMETLLDTFMLCFPDINYGEYLFTPRMHGARNSTRSTEKDSFTDSGKFGDYVAIVTAREFGISLRPYDIRRMVSTHLKRGKSTEEVQQSHAVLMGTSVANLRGMCNILASAISIVLTPCE